MDSSLLENGPIVFFAWSGEEGWPVKYVSSNVEELLGVSAKEFENNHVKFSDFIYKDDLKRINDEVNFFISSKAEHFIQEYRVNKRGFGTIWVEDFTVIKYANDKPLIINGYLVDSSNKKTVELENYKLANYDFLTNLPNRQKLITDMKNKISFACLIFDIDGFKEINDLFGISSGDSILKQVASWFLKIDITPYRIDGDEFAVLITDDLSQDNILKIITDILASLEEETFYINGEELGIRMSVGISSGSDVSLTRADIALSMAKERKLSYCFYDEKHNVEDIYRSNLAISKKIRNALINDRIICHYQPIVNCITGAITKYEALVRIVEKNGYIIAPLDFLPIAKKTKLYHKITSAVMTNACLAFKDKREDFSVNLSIKDIEDDATIDSIINVIMKTTTASKIIFELTESEQIRNYKVIENFITRVKSLGAKIAIDDFGTGYSNFEHILSLNLDFIKIDGALIKEIDKNNRHKIIVETIVDFANKIGVKTIAEYVCSEEVYNTVKDIGVDYAQGYFIGKPTVLA